MNLKSLFRLVAIFLMLVFPNVGHAAMSHLPATGQSTGYAAGDDGNLKAGLAWPGSRFLSNADTSITDSLTNLTWSPNGNNDGPSQCTPGVTKTWQGALDFVSCMNAYSYLGRTDWRLPNINELQSLMANSGQSSIQAWLETNGFVTVKLGNYWTSTTFATTKTSAWSVNAVDGSRSISSKAGTNNLLAVRGTSNTSTPVISTGQIACYDTAGTTISCTGTRQDGELKMGAVWPSTRFQTNADGTYSDLLTGLVWRATTVGAYTWASALTTVNALGSGWRLPNRNELSSLLDYSKSAGALATGNPLGTATGSHWVSTSYAPTTSAAYFIDIGYGFEGNAAKTASYTVWAVRGGQGGTLGNANVSTNPVSVDLGQVITSTLAPTATITLSNSGSSVLVMQPLQLTGTDASQFQLSIGSCVDLKPVLTAGQSCTVLVSARPTSAGAKGAVLRLITNDLDTPTLDVPLTVTGNNTTVTVTTSAGANGIIWPMGAVKAAPGSSPTFTIRGGVGYKVSDVQVDGMSVGAVSSYTFSNISGDHLISATFAAAATTTTSYLVLPATGQSTAYAAGDDGTVKAGKVWPAQRFTANLDATITDNLTNLTWPKNAYTDGPVACGPSTAKTWQAALTYVACLNTNGHLGYSDWRLPNVNEMESLVAHSGQSSVFNWLTGQGFTSLQSGYWTSTTYATTKASAWSVQTSDGLRTITGKGSSLNVLAVRGLSNTATPIVRTGQFACYDATGTTVTCAGTGQDGELQMGVAWPNPRFQTNYDTSVTDLLTGLVWEPASALNVYTHQASLNTSACTGTYSTQYRNLPDWSDAVSGELAKGGNWRLPNRFEFGSLIDYSKSGGVLATGNPLGSTAVGFWLSTTYAPSTGNAYFIDTTTGLESVPGKGVAWSCTPPSYYSWGVRGGQGGTLGLPQVAASPTTKDFGTVPVNTTSSPTTITISNSGTAVMVMMTPLQLAGTDASQFQLSLGTCLDTKPVLLAGQSCTVLVSARPTSAGAKGAVLRLITNDLDTPTLDVLLTIADNSAPSASSLPAPGSYTNSVQVSLSASDNYDSSPTIFYTLDGSDPTITSTLYTQPISFTTTTTIKYIARDFAGNISPVFASAYSINHIPSNINLTPATPGYLPNKFVADDGAAWAMYGISVAVDGDTAIVGAQGDASSIGAAYVYKRNSDSSWSKVQKLIAPGGAANDYFGKSVALSGDYALVGAPGNGNGFAYVFKRAANGTWSAEQKLVATGGVTGDGFGTSVSVGNGRALIGSPGNGMGAAYVFERAANGTWSQIQKLNPAGATAGDKFGQSVSLSGDRGLIGSHLSDALATDSGSAYVFDRQSNGSWTQSQRLNASDGAAGDYFGFTVSLSGDRAAIGSYMNASSAAGSGAAYVFEKSGVSWSQTQKLIAPDGAADDNFGYSVSIDGDRCAIGSWKDDDKGTDSGSAYLFDRMAGTWTYVQKLVPADGAISDYYGAAVSVSGTLTFVGAYMDDDKGSGSGSVYMHERVPSIDDTLPIGTKVATLSTVDADLGNSFTYSLVDSAGGKFAIANGNELQIAGALDAYLAPSYLITLRSTDSTGLHFDKIFYLQILKGVIVAPAAPVVTAASGITSSGFTANWNAAGGATGYRLDVATDSGFTSMVSGYSDLAIPNVTSSAVSGLSAATGYWYRVRAYNTGGTSGNSNSINPTTLPNPPSAPVATAASGITASSFTATWNASSGATGYRLDVATDSGFTSMVSGYSNKDVTNVTNYAVSGLSISTNYWYRVRAYNTGGTSGNSNSINPTTLPNPPIAPVASGASSITAISFTANWNTTSGATGYRLDVATDSSFTSMISGYNNKDVTNVTSYSISGLTAATGYWYRVRAYNTGGTSGDSNVINLSTLPNPPAAPVATTAIGISATGFSAIWNTSVSATGYRLDVATDSGFSSMVSGYNNKDVTNVTSYAVSGLTAATNYWYRVRAYNAGGTSGDSNSINPTTLPNPPVAPVATAATGISATGFSAFWNASVGATGYRLDVATDSGFTSMVSGFNNKDVSNVTSYSISGLTAATGYWYRVRAYNTGGIGSNSNSINQTTLPNPPSAPVATAASGITAGSFTANWNAAGGATGYLLDVATDSGFSSMVNGYSNKDVSNVTNYAVSGLTVATNYWYRVRAYNTGGTSGNSGSVNPVTLPNPPPVPVAISPSNIIANGFSANWNAAGGATGYLLDVATDSGFTSMVSGYNSKDVSNVTSSAVSGLTAATDYWYRVRAYNTGGTSSNSNSINLSTLPNPPSAPVAISPSNITAIGFTANWNAAGGTTGYLLDVATDIGFSNMVSGYSGKDVSNVTSSAVNGLTAETSYWYRVRAYNAGGISGNSNSVNPITLPNPPSAPVAISPGNITVNGFTANWNAASGANGYHLDVATDSSFTNMLSNYSDLHVGGVLSYQITGLSAGTEYWYRVRGSNAGVVGSNSNVISITTLSNPPSAPVANAAVNMSTTGFTASWNVVSGATGYVLDVATDSGFINLVSNYNNSDVANVTSFDVAGLSPGTTYWYRVSAYNAGGTSSNSNAVVLTTLTGAISRNLSVNISGTGTGSVNSIPSGIACTSEASCPAASYQDGAVVNIIQIPGANSVFTGWEGACTGTGTCSVIMDSDKILAANFDAASRVKVGTKIFNSIQNAYYDYATGDKAIIKMQNGTLVEDVTFDRDIIVTLDGGYDGSFINANTTSTLIVGKFIISAGKVIASGISLQ